VAAKKGNALLIKAKRPGDGFSVTDKEPNLRNSVVPIKFDKRVISLIICIIVMLGLISMWAVINKELTALCEDESHDGRINNGIYSGDCEMTQARFNSGHVIGVTSDIGSNLILPLLLLTIIIFISIGLQIFLRRRRLNCGNCGTIFTKKQLNKSSYRVISTSSSTKKIVSINPQLGVGALGKSHGSFVSLGTSSAHVPIELGRIVARHTCNRCKKKNRWMFDTEVRVWTDALTEQKSYELIGEIKYP